MIVGRFAGVLVFLCGILLATRLCLASPQHVNSVPSIFDPRTTPADSVYHLSLFVLSITGVIFVVVFTLLTYSIVKFRKTRANAGREPAQVYGSTQIELAWTVVPIVIVAVLFLASARVIHSVQDVPKPPNAVEVTCVGHQLLALHPVQKLASAINC